MCRIIQNLRFIKIKIKLMESYGWFAFPQLVSTANRDLLSLLENAFFLIPTSKSLVQKTVSSTLYKFVGKRFTVVPRCCMTVCLFEGRETRISQENSINIAQSPSNHQSYQKFLVPLAFNKKKSLTLQICLCLSPKIVVLTKLGLSSWSTGK